MKEFELIKLLTASLPANGSLLVGPGDDCAVLQISTQGPQLLFKADALVEGIHFTHDTVPEAVGHKALARALSDIAAMGGKPLAALITIGLPPDFVTGYVQRLYDGLNALAARTGVAIAGGETTTSPERIFLSISLLGTVEQGKSILRSGAQPGDAIFVTGRLGGSIEGKHLNFEPRLVEAGWLAAHFPPSAMIDISDGFAGDLRHLLAASGVGAELLSDAIPISNEARKRARNGASAKTPLLAALTDGEDYELLFTIPSKSAVPLLDGWNARFPNLKLSCVGKITSTPGVSLRGKRGVQAFPDHGYTHFS